LAYYCKIKGNIGENFSAWDITMSSIFSQAFINNAMSLLNKKNIISTGKRAYNGFKAFRQFFS